MSQQLRRKILPKLNSISARAVEYGNLWAERTVGKQGGLEYLKISSGVCRTDHISIPIPLVGQVLQRALELNVEKDTLFEQICRCKTLESLNQLCESEDFHTQGVEDDSEDIHMRYDVYEFPGASKIYLALSTMKSDKSGKLLQPILNVALCKYAGNPKFEHGLNFRTDEEFQHVIDILEDFLPPVRVSNQINSELNHILC
jgi:hypothetical protein